MASMQAPANAEMASISAVITRADGTVEDLGIISYWHRRWYMRAAWNIRHTLKGWRR